MPAPRATGGPPFERSKTDHQQRRVSKLPVDFESHPPILSLVPSPRALLLPLLLLLLCPGCRHVRSLPHPALPDSHQVGTSVEGRPIECLEIGSGSQCILLLATIHGNESAGTPLLQKLVQFSRQHAELLQDRKLVLVPIANPDGYVHQKRFNSHGIDLNRNFATTNRESNRRYGITELSEPESKLLFRLLDQYQPARIISIHQPLTCIDYDGPAAEIAARMAEYCDLPMKRVGSRPGSLGSYAGVDLGIPIITLELPRSASYRLPGNLWHKYGPALLAFVSYPEPPPLIRETPFSLILIAGTILLVLAILALILRRRIRKVVSRAVEE
jgi:protein MpaA